MPKRNERNDQLAAVSDGQVQEQMFLDYFYQIGKANASSPTLRSPQVNDHTAQVFSLWLTVKLNRVGAGTGALL